MLSDIHLKKERENVRFSNKSHWEKRLDGKWEKVREIHSQRKRKRGRREMEAQVEGKCCRLIFLRMIVSIIFCLTLLTPQHTVSFFLQNLNRSLHFLSLKCFFSTFDFYFLLTFFFPVFHSILVLILRMYSYSCPHHHVTLNAFSPSSSFSFPLIQFLPILLSSLVFLFRSIILF